VFSSEITLKKFETHQLLKTVYQAEH